MKIRARVLVLLLLLGGLAGTARAAVTNGTLGYRLDRWTADAGGGTVYAGDYALAGTIGQPDTGTSGSGGYRLDGGFWHDLAAANTHRIHLPLAVKSP